MTLKRDTLMLLIVILIAQGFVLISQAQTFEKYEISKLEQGAKGYVSDEVWYVDAARVILEKVFGLLPRMDVASATLVYDSIPNVEELRDLAARLGVTIVDTTYNKINAIYVVGVSRDAISLFAKVSNASDVVWGWRLGDAENINTYLNLEHPPLGKYAIALAMLLLGDRPFYWRIPSIIVTLITTIALFFVALRITRSEVLSLIIAGLFAADPMSKYMGSLAMLDIFVAAFGTLAILAALYRKYRLAALLVAIGASFKFSCLLTLLPLVLILVSDLVSSGRRGFSYVFSEALYFMSLSMTLFLVVFFVSSIPLMLYTGFVNWLQNAFIGAISWHLSVKCVGPECPIASTPIEWFFGINAFPLYIVDGYAIAAVGLVPIYVFSLVMAVLTIPYIVLEKGRLKLSWFLMVGLFLSYVLLWIAGSRSQYSFYAIHLSPFINLFAVHAAYDIMVSRDRLLRVLFPWYRIALRIYAALSIPWRYVINFCSKIWRYIVELLEVRQNAVS